MSDLAIHAEHLGKKYRIRHRYEQQRYVALRDVIAGTVRRLASAATMRGAELFRRVPSAGKHTATSSRGDEDFWALRDVSFSVNHGEVVGILGRNGAGKSTLLKVLSRITEPTTGRVRLRGRVASLLEVGTGFHPELTGKENIFLNGAILGMTRVEMKARFDEIVAFAGVEQFLDTPVKRYSSGMYVRLAFAVAAHLDPEILLVDEVLSVGDAEFQMKCLGKLRAVSASGRTVLYVSHNLASIANLCSRGILLDRGTLSQDTTAHHAIAAYLQAGSGNGSGEPHVLFVDPAMPSAEFRVTRMEMLDERDSPKAVVRPMDFVKLRIWFTVSSPIPQGSVLIELMSMDGVVILKLESNPRIIQPLEGDAGVYAIECCVASLPLMEGRYILGVGLAIYGVRLLSWAPDAATFLVSEPVLGAGAEMSVDRKGVLVVEHRWAMTTANPAPSKARNMAPAACP